MCVEVDSPGTYFEPIVCPGPELELTMLIIEGEPRDVNLARALEDPRRHVQHRAVSRGHDVRLECSIKSLVRAEMYKCKKSN